jgi:hypothetical protein
VIVVLGFRVWGLGLRDSWIVIVVLGFRVWGLGFRDSWIVIVGRRRMTSSEMVDKQVLGSSLENFAVQRCKDRAGPSIILDCGVRWGMIPGNLPGRTHPRTPQTPEQLPPRPPLWRRR